MTKMWIIQKLQMLISSHLDSAYLQVVLAHLNADFNFMGDNLYPQLKCMQNA